MKSVLMSKSKMAALFLSLMTAQAYSMQAPKESALDPFKVISKTPHDIVLLNHGISSLEERLRLIESAKKSIDIEYFIYRTDKSAKMFTQALVKKAREGVKVRMLLDYFMVKADLSPFYAHELEKEGIEVKYFNTTSTLNLFSGQYRNHRKALIVDGTHVVTGGRNIGDEYFDLSHEYNFLDRDITITGELAAAIEKTFNIMWADKKSEKVARDKMPSIYDSRYQRSEDTDRDSFERDLKNWNENVEKAKSFINDNEIASYDEVRALGREELDKEYRGTCNDMEFLSEYQSIGKNNRKNDRVIKHGILNRIVKAEKSVLIDSPYFIVNNELEGALNQAIDNKAQITLLTNSLNSTDAIYVYSHFDSTIKGWIEKGLTPFIFKGKKPEAYNVIESLSGKARFGVHAKTFIFDEKEVVIGTYNVDPRSANYNAEMVVTCKDNLDLVQAVKNDIELRIGNSFKLDSAAKVDEVELYEASFIKSLTYYILKGPSLLFDYLL